MALAAGLAARRMAIMTVVVVVVVVVQRGRELFRQGQNECFAKPVAKGA